MSTLSQEFLTAVRVEVQRLSCIFPSIAQDLEDSLRVPQKGPYHNEGDEMDAHLGLILQTLDDVVVRNNFHASVPDAVRVLIREIATSSKADGGSHAVSEEMRTYAMLHDIAKKDCLALKLTRVTGFKNVNHL